MSSFSDGVPDLEKNVSIDSVGEIPSIGEVPSGSRPFAIWKEQAPSQGSFFGRMFSVEEGPWQGQPI
jgi:hypothetical protein